jgi:uncharacterized membrane protein YgcG
MSGARVDAQGEYIKTWVCSLTVLMELSCCLRLHPCVVQPVLWEPVRAGDGFCKFAIIFWACVLHQVGVVQVPELKSVPAEHIAEPWKMPKQVQQGCGVHIGQDYPHPIPASRMTKPHGNNRYPNRGTDAGSRSGGSGGGGGGRGGRGSRSSQAPRGRRPVKFY